MEKRITAGDYCSSMDEVFYAETGDETADFDELKTALEAQREVLSESLDALKKISPLNEALNAVESHLLDAIGDLDEAIAMVVVFSK